MKRNTKFYASILWLILGSILVVLAFAGKVDEFWNGMGSALLIVGTINLLRTYRLHKNKAYREQFEIEVNDERNLFIRNKSWAWAGYLFIMIAAILCIVFKIIGQDALSLVSSAAICLMLVLYWISFAILKRKY